MKKKKKKKASIQFTDIIAVVKKLEIFQEIWKGYEKSSVIYALLMFNFCKFQVLSTLPLTSFCMFPKELSIKVQTEFAVKYYLMIG